MEPNVAPDHAVRVESPGPAMPRWVALRCDGRAFAVTLDRVRAILAPVPFTRVPGCGDEVCGLAGVRGRVVTVFDLGAAVGLRPAAARHDHRLLIVEHAQRVLGVVVDEVVEVADGRLDESDAGDEAANLGLGPDEITGACRIGALRCLAVSLDRMMARLLGGPGVEARAHE